MRLVIELKREAVPMVVLNKLYKHTQMQTTFGVINIALVGGVPRTLTLPESLKAWISFQKEVIVRRTKFELDKAETRAHILEGLLVALDNLDQVIAMIRRAPDVDDARDSLMDTFELTRPAGPGHSRPATPEAHESRARQGDRGAPWLSGAHQGAARVARR